MLIDLPAGGKARLIGDPHTGLKFETGVPLHRRGEREKKQFAKFKTALAEPNVRYNIMVGDLFEHPYVGHGVVVDTAEAYITAAAALPDTTFVALAGNHDRPRAVGQTGAWESFRAMVEDRLPNLHVVDNPQIWDEIIFFPWEWSVGAEQQAMYLIQEDTDNPPPRIAVGHWDLKSYGGDDSHLCPTKVLAKGFCVEAIYSGHYHTPGDYQVNGHTVHCTGSLEPYSHGEDPNEDIYVTRSLAEVLDDPEAFKDKCVRVMLAPGEALPTHLDCLAITPQRVSGESTEIPEIQMEGFDWDKVLEHELAQVGDREVVSFIRSNLKS